ncbi:MAG: hypothetical protein U9Q06_03460 [Nanoarchaeota archaeon]|nr:hypothetical protein [Nanoarchaeota archaeon]
MENSTRQFGLKRGQAEITVPHLDDTLTFVFPEKGPGDCDNVGKAIDDAKLARPTFSQDISLLHSIYCDTRIQGVQKLKKSSEAQHIKDYIMNDRRLWAFTRLCWTPQTKEYDKGVFVYESPEDIEVAPEDLVKQLGSTEENHVIYSDDRTIRFVPEEFVKLGECTSSQLRKSSYILALATHKEQAENLAQIAGEFNFAFYMSRSYMPGSYMPGSKNVGQPEQKRASLSGGWGGGGLVVDGCSDDDACGCACGVLNNSEGVAPKNSDNQ